MTEIIREIDEELQAKHYAALAKKYGKYVATVVLLLVISFGGYGFWQSHSQAKIEQRAADFAILLSNAAENATAHQTQAEEWAEFAAADNDAFSLMAWRFAVAAYLRDNQNGTALQVMQGLSDNAVQDSDYRAFAEFMAQILTLNNNDNNGTEAQALPIPEDSPFAEFAVLAEAERLLKAGDSKAAAAVLQTSLDKQDNATQDPAVQTLFSELIGALQSVQ